TNTMEAGAIELKKNVDTANAPEQTFTFALELSDKTISATYSGVAFTNGAATVTLKAGESLKIEGLPVGLDVKITEAAAGAGWTTKVKAGAADAAAAMEATVTVVKNETQVVEFINSYAADGEVAFGGMKTIEGRDLAAGEFSFELKNEAGEVIETVQNAADGSIAFSAIKYELGDAGKTFKYTVSEVKGTLAGVTYDETVYTVEVKVEDNGDGTLTATATENAKSLNFVNKYAADGEVTFGGMKLLEGRDLKEKEFSFELRDEAGNVLQTVTNAADGSFTFEAIEYDLEDAGKTHTYTYRVSEQKGTLPGVTYDETVYTVTVEVVDNGDGTLTATASENAKNLIFTNKYAADGEVTFGGVKTIEGRDLAADEFSFELKNEAGEVIETVQNAADGSIAFSAIKYELGDAGKTFKYTVSEVKGALAGVTYDETVYTVEVKVEDNGDGTLTATASENANELNFVNKALGKLRLSKSVTGEGADKTLSFDFTIGLKDKDGQPVTATYFGNAFIGGQNVTAQVNVTDGSVVIALKDGEWIEISGIPVGYTYEVTESPVENFTSSATGASGMITTGVVEAAFINRYEMKRGGLMVTKSVVSPNAADLERKFTFTVELGDETINGTYGQMSFENGVAVFELGDGESIYASNLPEGLAYTVEEEAIEGFTPTVMSGETSGVIVANVEPRIAFVNTREIEYGSLTVKKTITGDAADKTKKFTFRVTLDQQLTGEYGEMTFENGVATFKLGHNETITATDLPEGVGYTVTELDSADYVVTCTYETGTIQAKKTVTATFINNREKGTVPKTGDDSHLGLYAVMLAMSSAAMLYMALRRRKA
ncbi:MAG: sortase B protein-sorting domain-containing protein, partial [Clostridia bacterium]|nr:sortase B protein-sorting domain-containing protein [Clostridia bacterium]